MEEVENDKDSIRPPLTAPLQLLTKTLQRTPTVIFTSEQPLEGFSKQFLKIYQLINVVNTQSMLQYLERKKSAFLKCKFFKCYKTLH